MRPEQNCRAKQPIVALLFLGFVVSVTTPFLFPLIAGFAGGPAWIVPAYHAGLILGAVITAFAVASLRRAVLFFIVAFASYGLFWLGFRLVDLALRK